jgi:HD superfamily phosphohydrolase YqeK
MEYSVDPIKKRLKGRLGEKRYDHNIKVADLARELVQYLELMRKKPIRLVCCMIVLKSSMTMI